MKLSVRDRPLPGESFAGYLIRLADYNGRRTVNELLGPIGLDEKASLFASHQQAMEHACQLIAPMINYPVESLVNHFQEQFINSWVFNETRKIRSITLSQPRICIQCCVQAEEPFIHNHWALLPVTHCTQHSSVLIDSCPGCNTQLEWTFDIFRTCNACGLDWHDHTTEISNIPFWQQEFETLLQINKNELLDWLDSFCEKVIKSARPLDQYHDAIYSIPAQTTNILALVKQAYDPDQKQMEWPPEGFVKARRLKLQDTINQHIRQDGFALALGIKPVDVTSLVQSNLITPIYNSPVVRDMLFNIRDADRLIKNVKVIDSCPEGYIEVSAESGLLGLYDAKYGQLLSKAVVDGSVYRFVYSNNLNCIYVEKKRLVSHLESLLEESCAGLIPIQRALRILRISRDELTALIKNGTLRLGRHSSTANRIIGSSLWAFINTSHSSLTRRQNRLKSFGIR
ncbi:TniQ family protein [Neptunomonas qingdaonensis]|uniref:TniQ protein n=1 Tax=Neptunomonas qingdaonensis TaxID=1045558 RepID=A0A1I2QVP8_9GAMM|nr:TniQ family protein [Neptunomonas qingdaonensis]SFG30367.1 TniQ protein [Neptunomonas qingdaonensis]